MIEDEQKRLDIRKAMQYRVLSADEAKYALNYGYLLVVDWGVGYKESDKKTEYLELWYQQARLRALDDQKK